MLLDPVAGADPGRRRRRHAKILTQVRCHAKQINFTIVPDDPGDSSTAGREYANFCAVAHTPFDLTLTFCDVRPLSEHDIRQAEAVADVKAPVVARIALPFGVVPGLIAALQEQMRARAGRAAPTQDSGHRGPRARCTRRRARRPGRRTRRLERGESSTASKAQHPNAWTELTSPNAVRTARRDDPVGAVHRRAREPGHAGALRALPDARGAGGGEPEDSSRSSADRLLPHEVAQPARRWRARSSSSTAARSRPTMEALVKLPGVGRKTANVVLGHAFGVPGLPVDRHVLRVANRIGLVDDRRRRGRGRGATVASCCRRSDGRGRRTR